MGDLVPLWRAPHRFAPRFTRAGADAALTTLERWGGDAGRPISVFCPCGRERRSAACAKARKSSSPARSKIVRGDADVAPGDLEHRDG